MREERTETKAVVKQQDQQSSGGPKVEQRLKAN